MSNITSDSIKDKENQISKAEEEKDNLNSSLSDIKALKAELEAQKADLKKYVAALDSNVNTIEQNISTLKSQIAKIEEDIQNTRLELEEAIEIQNNQYETMMRRIKLMYELGNTNYLELMFTSENFGDLLNATDYVSAVLSYDDNMLTTFQQNAEYIALVEQKLELEKEILDESKVGLENEQAVLEELIQEKNNTINAYENDISNKEQSIEEYEAEIQQQNEIIGALEAAIEEEKKKILAENGSVIKYDGGVFKFPMASYTRISDDYGWRTHPILGVQQFHNGVDFAAPKGTAIYAAYDGVVVAATYSSTMGNYVMINHGDNLYTIYMHASALYVEKDAVVTRGETIAAVGSTGRSTGNHLHFTVRLNGEYQSPWNYLSE